MRINIKTLKRQTLFSFAEEHDLVLEVAERSPALLGDRWTEDLRFYAAFPGVEVAEGGCLSSVYGNGATIEKAVDAYAAEISEKHIAIDALSRTLRRDIQVPVLTGWK